jgi:hypothetical protein
MSRLVQDADYRVSGDENNHRSQSHNVAHAGDSVSREAEGGAQEAADGRQESGSEQSVTVDMSITSRKPDGLREGIDVPRRTNS